MRFRAGVTCVAAVVMGAALPPLASARPNPDDKAPVSTNGRTLEQAVQCAAALQVAALAAPKWSADPAIVTITNTWLAKVFELGAAEGVSGDKVPELVKAEMQRQVERAGEDPGVASRRAFNCASIAP
ncbi:MAG: hypothetical protein RL186_1440 [Pseudomonadota bacterium]|jgi:hypothetical protein